MKGYLVCLNAKTFLICNCTIAMYVPIPIPDRVAIFFFSIEDAVRYA